MNTTDAVLPGLVRDLAHVCRRLGREELAAHLERQVERLGRESLVVAVTGDFKRGKSSLVNALLARDICPVDVTRSTAVPTVLRYGTAECVVATTGAAGGEHEVEAPLARLPDLVLSDLAATTASRTVVATVRLDSALLEEGFTIIDGPGTGGLSRGFQEVAKNLASLSDVVLVVVDAGTPLSEATLDFLCDIASTGQEVVVVATRADLYRRHGAAPGFARQLEQRGLDLPVFPVSSAVARVAARTGDVELERESGIPDVRRALRSQSVQRERKARVLLASEARRVLDDVVAMLDATSAEEPEAAWDARLAGEQASLESARRDAARWNTLLNEGVADAASAAEADLRTRLRDAGREIEEQLESLRAPARSEDFRAEVMARAQDALSATFASLGRRLEALDEELRGLFAVGRTPGESMGPAVQTPVWETGDKKPEARVKAAAGGVYASLKGAQSGIIMVGVFAGIAGLGLGTMAILGIGAAFGARQILDERGKRTQVRRQQVRAAVRQYLDEVLVEGGRAIRELARQELRRQREELADVAAACVAARVAQCRWVEEQRAAARDGERELERQRAELIEMAASIRIRLEALPA